MKNCVDHVTAGVKLMVVKNAAVVVVVMHVVVVVVILEFWLQGIQQVQIFTHVNMYITSSKPMSLTT